MSQEQVIKVTLGTSKVVLLRPMKIKFQTQASTAVGRRAGDNTMAMATLMQQELLKIMLVSIDGHKVTANEREDLDNLFTYQEYTQLGQVIGKMMGGEEAGEAKTEIVNTGTP